MTTNTHQNISATTTSRTPGRFERFIDRRLAKQDRSPEAVGRRRFAAGITVGAVAVGGLLGVAHQILPQEKGVSTVTVADGDTLQGVVCEGQTKVAEVVPSVEADDPACITGAVALSDELIRNTGNDIIHSGDTVQVKVSRSGLGLQEVSADVSSRS